MTEGDGPIEMKDCNEGRFRLMGLLDFHTWRWEKYLNHDADNRTVIEKCRTCGAERKRWETATWL